jgi:hypothetical protein
MKSSINVTLVCVTVLGGALVLTHAFLNRNRANDLITVTGLAERHFDSDLVVWEGRFRTLDKDLKAAFAALERDRQTVRGFLKERAIGPDAVAFSAVEIDKRFSREPTGQPNTYRDVFVGYQLTQQLRIESTDIGRIEKLSREITELINLGVEIYSEAPKYYYTKLGALKVEMLGLATKNAYERARRIAENAKGRLGKLKFARLGVFQIVARNSDESYTWSGAYNTSSMMKTGAVTVKLQYELD